MKKILACVDNRGNTDAVIDWAAWAAVRMDCALEFLHVLERHPETAAVTDLSGAIGVDAQESLLKELSEKDAAAERGDAQRGARAAEPRAQPGCSRWRARPGCAAAAW